MTLFVTILVFSYLPIALLFHHPTYLNAVVRSFDDASGGPMTPVQDIRMMWEAYEYLRQQYDECVENPPDAGVGIKRSHSAVPEGAPKAKVSRPG